MPSWETLAAYWPGWISLAVGFYLVFIKTVEESDKFAKVLGSWGRKIRAKSLARHHVDLAAAQFAEATATAVNHAVEAARKEWEGKENQALSSLSGRLETVSSVTIAQREDIEELLFQVRCLTAYAEYEALWHNKFRVAGARSGDGTLTLADLPSHVGYYDFEALYKEDQNWRGWIDP